MHCKAEKRKGEQLAIGKQVHTSPVGNPQTGPRPGRKACSPCSDHSGLALAWDRHDMAMLWKIANRSWNCMKNKNNPTEAIQFMLALFETKLVDRLNIQPFVKAHSQSCFSIPLDKELFQDLPRPNSTNTWSCCPVFQVVTSNPRWEHGKWEQLPNMLQLVKPQPHTLDFQVAERLHGIRNVRSVQDQVYHPEPEKLSKKHENSRETE